MQYTSTFPYDSEQSFQLDGPTSPTSIGQDDELLNSSEVCDREDPALSQEEKKARRLIRNRDAARR